MDLKVIFAFTPNNFCSTDETDLTPFGDIFHLFEEHSLLVAECENIKKQINNLHDITSATIEMNRESYDFMITLLEDAEIANADEVTVVNYLTGKLQSKTLIVQCERTHDSFTEIKF